MTRIHTEQAILVAKKILAHFGEKYGRFLGSGSYGWAFKAQADKVLKIGYDDQEFNAIRKLYKTRTVRPGIMNYYNVGIFKISDKFNKEESWDNGYFALMDYVLTLTKIENRLFSILYSSYRSDFIPIEKQLINPVWVRERLIEFHHLEYLDEANKFIPFILEFIKNLKKSNLKSFDIHGGNMGWNEDLSRLIHFDPMIDSRIKGAANTEIVI